LLASDPLEGVEKLIRAHAIFQILKERIHRHTRPAKTRAPTQALRIAPAACRT
jgi:hypothetical protein